MENQPNDKTVLLFNDTRSARHFGCEAVMQSLLSLLQGAGFPEPECIDLSLSSRWRKRAWVKARLRESSMVVVNGEGSIHHSNARARGLAELGIWCKSNGVPCALVNATLYANDELIYKGLACYDVVSVRDRASQSEAQRFGVRTEWAPDLTFGHRLLDCPFASGSPFPANSAALTLSSPTLSSPASAAALSFLEAPSYETLSPAACRGPGVQSDDSTCGDVSFLAGHDTGHGTDQNTSPYPGKRTRVGDSVEPEIRKSLRRLAHHKGWNFCRIRSNASREFVNYVERHRNAGFVVTGRFHDVCFCLNAGIPFVAVESNTNKVAALLHDVFGNTRRLIEPDEMLSTSYEAFWNYTSDETRAISQYKELGNTQLGEMQRVLKSLWLRAVAM